MQDSPKPFYSELKILKITDLYKLEIGKLVHAQFFNKLPYTLSNYLIESSNMSQKTPKNVWKGSKNFNIPKCSTAQLQRCIKYQGVKIWNEIFREIQNTSTITFKKRYKEHLLHYYK